MNLTRILISVVLYVLASLPLHFAVKFLRGRTNLIKTIFINLIVGFLVAAIKEYVGLLGGIVAFFVSVFIYREAFRLKWWKAFIVWLVQLAFVVLFYFIALIIAAVLGMGLFLALF